MSVVQFQARMTSSSVDKLWGCTWVQAEILQQLLRFCTSGIVVQQNLLQKKPKTIGFEHERACQSKCEVALTSRRNKRRVQVSQRNNQYEYAWKHWNCIDVLEYSTVLLRHWWSFAYTAVLSCTKSLGTTSIFSPPWGAVGGIMALHGWM